MSSWLAEQRRKLHMSPSSFPAAKGATPRIVSHGMVEESMGCLFFTLCLLYLALCMPSLTIMLHLLAVVVQ
ncbi:hypothetical protein BDZ85DRAFT_124330 [Elsinoe ampelina]|uniref:Uncharacterized protein n=1 Tax=Elsinoe ampelina TaxID=302913 RepID=A0A6A6GBZ4_9PEZI|nr:hypothetical protein BDZ85DRAFT_124330 [Elsinoe ampelina]